MLNLLYQKISRWLDSLAGWQGTVVLTIISVLLALPPFVVLYQFMPVIKIGEERFDHLILLAAVILLVYLFVKKYRKIFYFIMLGGLVVIALTSVVGFYGIGDFYDDYRQLLFSIQERTVQVASKNQDAEFSKEDQLKSAIDYNDKNVRNFAANIAAFHFEDWVNSSNRKMVQSFSIFHEIRKRWVYVHDPNFEDYYAPASETLKMMQFDNRFKGDCDDYSILMAACIKAIGGEVRLVRTVIINEDGSETWHLFPEVKIGNEKDLEKAAFLIKEELFVNQSRNKEIYYHKDPDGSIWLNFDYNDYYPGGKYQSAIRETVIEI